MVDFHNPAVIEKDFLALIKLWHVLDGIFIWEFFTTLDFEWSIIRGNRPNRPIWIYSLTRVFTLITLILNMVGFDSSIPINCQLWVIIELIFGSLAFAAASALIVLRIIAIWDWNRIAVAIAICAWSTNVAFLIHYTTQILAAWAPEQSVCVVLNTETGVKNVIATLVSDVALLLTMLIGLFRLRVHGNMFGLGQLLWNQGLIWLLLATIAEVPPAVFISLNLNGPLNLMFQTPGLVVMSIGATRMHRSLTDFADSGSRTRSSFDSYPTRRGNMAGTDPRRIFAASVPLNRVEVSVHTSSNSKDYTPENMGQYASYGSSGANNQSKDNPLVLIIDRNIEDDVKRG